MNTLSCKAQRLVQHMGTGELRGNAYDTAWVASIKKDSGRCAVPNARAWIVANQRADGSWGSATDNLHDRVISTTAALMCLCDDPKHQTQAEKGREYLEKAVPALQDGDTTPVGFEMSLPPLIDKIEQSSGAFSFSISRYRKKREKKLKRIPDRMRMSHATPLVFSWEIWDEDDTPEIPLAPNGSIGSSPASTTALMKRSPNAEGMNYLNRSFDMQGNGGVVAFNDYSIMNRAFTLYNLMRVGMPITRIIRQAALALKEQWTSAGVAFSPNFPVPDVDDTAVALWVMRKTGVLKGTEGLDTLRAYWDDDHFRTYPFESDPSTVANAHVLDALNTFPSSAKVDEMREGTLGFLKSRMVNGDHWTGEKFYLSDIHATAHIASAVGTWEDQTARRGIDWLEKQRKQNNLWGIGSGTAEETAYALTATILHSQEVENLDIEHLRSSAEEIRRAIDSKNDPDIWIAKTLFSPTDIVRSAKIGAVMAFDMEVK